MPKKSFWKWLLLLLGLLTVAGCDRQIAATVTPLVDGICEAGTYGKIFVWHDTNQNSLYEPDEGERPFSRVIVGIGTIETVTDTNGNAVIDVFGIGMCGCQTCTDVAYVKVPDGYKPTTRASFPAQSMGDYQFGLVDDPLKKTIPYEAKLSCQSYLTGSHNLGLGPDGSIWAGIDDGTAQYDPQTDQFILHQDGKKHPGEIAVGAGGVIWFNEPEEPASRYHAEKWTVYPRDSMVARGSLSLTVTADRKVWFPIREDGGYRQLARFDPQKNEWVLYRQPQDAKEKLPKLKVFTDGAVWFAAPNKDATLPNPKDDSDLEWSVNTIHTFHANEIVNIPNVGYISDTAIADDGTIWLATRESLTRYNPSTKQRKTFPWPEVMNTSTLSPRIALAPDGAIWISTAAYFRPLLLRLSNNQEQYTWTSYDERDGLPILNNGEIGYGTGYSDIIIPHDGKIWLGTSQAQLILACSVLKTNGN